MLIGVIAVRVNIDFKLKIHGLGREGLDWNRKVLVFWWFRDCFSSGWIFIFIFKRKIDKIIVRKIKFC